MTTKSIRTPLRLRPGPSRSVWVLIGALFGVFGGPPSTADAAGDCSPWTRKADPPTGRLGCRATTVDGFIYVVGGYAAANGPGLATLEEYDPLVDSWSTRAPMPTPRRRLSLSSVNGKLYAIGGNHSLGAPSLRTVEIYDPTPDEWTRGTDMPTERFAPATAVVAGEIYVIGGVVRPSRNGVTSFSSVVEVYDPTTDSWSRRSGAPTRRGAHAAAVVDGRIYVIGGTVNPTTSFLRTVEMYDPSTDTWEVLDAMPTPRSMFPAATIDGKIYAIGGLSTGRRAIAKVDVFDVHDGTWSDGRELPGDRFDPAAVALNGRVYAIGGAGTASAPHPGLPTLLEYDTLIAASISLSSDPGVAGEEIVFDASATVAPPEATISEHQWDFGDGTTAQGPVVAHAYETPGRYEVRLEVTDGEGVCHPATKLLLIDGTSNELGPWKAADVGEPAFPGAARIEETGSSVERLRLWAGGDRLAGTDDEHFLLTQQVDCDAVLTARLDAASLPVRSQVGLTLREGDAADARHVSLVLERSIRGTELRVRQRLESGGSTTASGEAFKVSAPIWLRLERTDDTVSAFWSPADPERSGGSAFDLFATVELPGLTENVLLGFAGMGAEPSSETSPYVLLDATWSAIDLVCTDESSFVRGDCTADGSVDISDAACILNWLFAGAEAPRCLAAANPNGDDDANLADATYLLNHLFSGGPAPLGPFPECGPGPLPADEKLGCASPRSARSAASVANLPRNPV